jgi:hypothetical protein
VKLHLNLRFDLCDLSDAELAERLEAISELREKLGLASQWSDPMITARGPIRHPFCYRFLQFFGRGGGTSEISAIFAAWLASSPNASSWLLTWDRGANVFVLNCELLDLHDELERRVRFGKGVRT